MLKKTLKNRQGISLIFSIIVVTALLITTLTLNEVIIRNVKRVNEMGSILQAQSSANSAFEEALVYVSQNCDAGCDTSDTITVNAADLTTYATYEVFGKAETDGSYYYVPIQTLGNAASECTIDESEPEFEDDSCNWNRLYYGDTISVPLYVDGADTFDGSTLEVRIRTPDEENILCSDGTESTSISGCTLENNPVIVAWQITGERDDGSDYIEGYENTHDDAFLEDVKYRETDDSHIHTTRINYAANSSDYTTLSIDDLSTPDPPKDIIEDALQDATDPLTYPTLELSFVQSALNVNEEPVTYLEYQIKTDAQISTDRSYITVTGYTESQDNTYFWAKEGWWSQYSSSPINFAFQN